MDGYTITRIVGDKIVSVEPVTLEELPNKLEEARKTSNVIDFITPTIERATNEQND